MKQAVLEYTLPKVFKHKWMEALRGGYYTQTNRYLHSNESYCCLGVACKISGVKNKIMEGNGNGHITDSPTFKRLPNALKINGSGNQLQIMLIKLNDGLMDATHNPSEKMFTFKEIASWIEENVNET
jgi:hypothetical protein